MAEHSPTPWRIDGTFILDSDGGAIAAMCEPDYTVDAAFIVEAVNAVDATLKLQRTLLGWSMERDTLNEVAAALQRSRDAALAEAERLRDLVRRLIPAVEEAFAAAREFGESVKGICALKGVDSSEVDVVLNQWTALLDEAREALGEDKP